VRPLRLPAPLLLSVLLAVPAAAAERVTITVLQTSDLHANLLPWNYARGEAADWGLARVATRVREVRRRARHVLLLDGGDTIQGAPAGWLEARRPLGGPHFMATAMNALGYDAMSVGNHEFNFGLGVLRRAQKDSAFPWLSANTRNKADGGPAYPE
jgi:2',3'-cyclic-nucleotide 2'-phosphodiesterase/3'-nucleotidase